MYLKKLFCLKEAVLREVFASSESMELSDLWNETRNPDWEAKGAWIWKAIEEENVLCCFVYYFVYSMWMEILSISQQDRVSRSPFPC